MEDDGGEATFPIGKRFLALKSSISACFAQFASLNIFLFFIYFILFFIYIYTMSFFNNFSPKTAWSLINFRRLSSMLYRVFHLIQRKSI